MYVFINKLLDTDGHGPGDDDGQDEQAADLGRDHHKPGAASPSVGDKWGPH